MIIGTAFAVTAMTAAGCGIESAPPAVYGPPEEFTSDAGNESEMTIAPQNGSGNTSAEQETQTFKPEEEIPEDVYGPPEYFE